MLMVILLLLLSAFFYYKEASLTPKTPKYFSLGLLGCILSIGVLILFTWCITALNAPYGFVGAVSDPTWIDWGPDFGFFLVLFSTSLALVGLIIKAKN
jgi:hypothetical protein